MKTKTTLTWVGLLLGALLGHPALSLAQAQGNPAARSSGAGKDLSPGTALPAGTLETPVDLRALKSQMKAFQEALNRTIQESFEQPFSLLQDAKGTYLPHFGVVFSLEVNLLPLRPLTPFDLRPYTDEEIKRARATKLARIRQLKDRLSEVLLRNGSELSAVPPDQNVAISIHLFHLPWEQSDDLPTQLVMETSRRTLLNASSLLITAKDLRELGVFLEF